MLFTRDPRRMSSGRARRGVQQSGDRCLGEDDVSDVWSRRKAKRAERGRFHWAFRYARRKSDIYRL